MQIGDKFIKDLEVVEIKEFEIQRAKCRKIVWFYSKNYCYEHCLTESDFLKQYKPYAPVYEYMWAYGGGNSTVRITEYETDEEFKRKVCGMDYQRLDFTKRERV